MTVKQVCELAVLRNAQYRIYIYIYILRDTFFLILSSWSSISDYIHADSRDNSVTRVTQQRYNFTFVHTSRYFLSHVKHTLFYLTQKLNII